MIKTILKAGTWFVKATINSGKSYWVWVNKVADNHQVPEAKRQKMLSSGKYKTPEDVDKAVRQGIKVLGIIGPTTLLAVLSLATRPSSPPQNTASSSYKPQSLPPSPANSISSTDKAESQGEKFSRKLSEESNRLSASDASLREYTAKTLAAWKNQPNGIEFAYQNACKDYSGEATSDQLAEDAYRVNDGSIPLGQLKVHYQAKFIASEYAGCQKKLSKIETPKPIESELPESNRKQVLEKPLSGQGRLFTTDQGSQINVRDEPSSTSYSRHVGYAGDLVDLISQSTGQDGKNWYKVKFESGASGWIFSEFLSLAQDKSIAENNLRENPVSEVPPVTMAESSSSSTGTGNCVYPDDLDSRGRRCGKRASSVR